MTKKILALFTLSVFFLSSCGSDDEREARFFTGDCKQSISLEWKQANSTVTTAPDTIYLDDMLKNYPGFGTPIFDGELLLGDSNTSARIIGLPIEASLKDFRISINGKEMRFGEISHKNANLNLYTSDNNKNFFEPAFRRMIADKRLITKTTFTPTVDGVEDVKLEIVFSGKFSYWVKL